LRKRRTVRKTKIDAETWMPDHPQKDMSEEEKEYDRR
jgi:hypothetical protein